MPDYDIITIGGGLGGASFARAMAERGYRVLVLERETQFKDRVRGEWLAPWGVAEAQALGVYDLLLGQCGHHPSAWETRLAGNSIGLRDLSATTGPSVHPLTFYHPSAQEALLASAENSGAEVRRGARVREIQAGAVPSVLFEVNGRSESATARLVAGADGRGSMVRKWGGFESKEDPDAQWLAGILIESTPAPMDCSVAAFNPFTCRLALMFPQGDGRARFYFGARATEPGMQGEKDVPRFIEESVKAGMSQEYFEGARPAGPLATFSGAESWVDHPHREGIALIGDAAAQSDQTWGQGMAMTLRDVRVLRDALLANDDWDAAGNIYAEEHDRQFHALHTVEGW
ncbi:MAG TPA: FAD-dependent monooxygenase, partial [Dehalococcoidia bacterium]|nr:FAD-dependent monooxygenase [Dehalococcoidia bacterium]